MNAHEFIVSQPTIDPAEPFAYALSRAGWMGSFAHSILAIVFVIFGLWLLLIIVRKPVGGDVLAYGLAKALFYVSVLIVQLDLIHSYFYLGNCGPQFTAMYRVNCAISLASFTIEMSITLVLLFGTMFRYRSRPELSAPGLIGVSAALVAMVINIAMGFLFCFS